MENSVKMPKPLWLGNHVQSTVGQPILQWKRWIEAGSPKLSERMVMGYRLPKWQRGFVWTKSQKVKLIESIWLGLNIGTYTFNRSYDAPEYDDLLIDGQQRMKAIEEYVTDQFPVFGAVYSEISAEDSRRLLMTAHFSCYITETTDDEDLRDYYNTMNFGGTSHKESERA